MSNTFPTVSVQNKLKDPFVVYDSFRNTGAAGSNDMFGTLTPVATVQPGATAAIIPIHGPISCYLAYAGDGTPIAREVAMGDAPVSFAIDNDDTKRIASTQRFYDAIMADQKGSLATTFTALLNAPKAATNVNAFFQANPPYKDCTFISYMMVAAAKARTPGKPVQSAGYSLSRLCNSLGGVWPSAFPDITITNFTSTTDNDTLVIGGDVDLQSLPFDPISAPFIRSLIPSTTVHATFRFHYGFDLGALGTRIEVDLPTMTLMPGLTIRKATISLDINPLFKFVVFGVKATIPFKLFNNDPFDALLTLTIDNLEASVGIVIDGNHASLTPPMAKGVHFDQFGVGMGIFFEPPGYVIGVQGKFHIGDNGGLVALQDDTFAIVCRMEGDVPDPLYLSFYVPKMQLADIITMFTNASVDIGLPLTITDLSYRWSKAALEPVILPDGTLSKPGYGFSGTLDLFGLSFRGDYNIDLTGIEANATMSPFSLGPLKLAGNGPGVSMKFDANGNPIHNNQVATTKAMRDAVAKATTRQIVAPGGPSLKITTSGSPFLSLGANVSIFDLVANSITATVDTGGIKWEQDLGAVVQSKMRCTLATSGGFQGDFTYGLDLSVPLPSIAGFSLGSIPLKAMFDATLGIKASASDPSLTVGGGFDFEGLRLSIGPYSIDVHTGKFVDVIDSIGKYILDHAGDLFSSIIGDAGKWAQLVLNEAIDGVTAVAEGLKTAFNKTAEEVAGIMKGVGYGIDYIARELQSAYGATADALASVLKGAGYGIDQTAEAIQSAYGATADTMASALKGAGYAADEISRTMSSTLGYSADAINTALQGAGFAADQVESAFKSVGGKLGDFAHSTWDHVSGFFSSGC